MKTLLNPNSLEWKIAFNLGYWRAIHLADRGFYYGDAARHRSLAVVDIAREAVRGMGRARRRAFGAQIRSTLHSTLQWKRNLHAA